MGVSYERRYRHEGLHNAWTNSEREAVIEHNNDPLCRFNFTLNGYEEMLKMAMLAYTGGYTPQNPAMPIRFFSGEDDPCALSRQTRVQRYPPFYRNGKHKARNGKQRADTVSDKNTNSPDRAHAQSGEYSFCDSAVIPLFFRCRNRRSSAGRDRSARR